MHMPGREDTRVCETCVSIRDSDDDVWGLEPPVVPRVAYVASPTNRAVNGRAAAVDSRLPTGEFAVADNA